MDLSSALKTYTMINKYHNTSRSIIQGRLSKHQLLASLNVSDKSMTHSLDLPCMSINGQGKNEVYTFALKLYLNFKPSEPRNYIALSITNKNDVTIKLSVEVSLEKQFETLKKISLERFGKYSCFLDKDEERKSYFLKEKIMRDPTTYLPEGKMIIVCDITMDSPNAFMVRGTKNSSIDICACKHWELRYAPENFFDPVHGYSDELSNFTIAVQKCSFKCHKVILSSKSEVFQHMFMSNMKEARTDHLSIKDMSSETVSSLLIFIYTDYIDPKKISIELLGAADKYMVARLKGICEEELSKRVNIENACEYWYEAYLHSTFSLQETTEEFIAKNMNDIKDTQEFQDLEIKMPVIVKNISSLLSNGFKI